VGSKSLAQFRAALGKRGYVLRHRPPVDPSGRRVRLSGFGVEMHLKSTEYKVVDDAHVQQQQQQQQQQLQDNLEPVPKGEVGRLGARIAQTIAKSSDPLEALQRLSQNFPSESHLYRKVALDRTFLSAIEANQQRMQPGHTAVLINGRHVNVANVNFFELLEIVAQEIRTSVALRSISGLSAGTARALTIRSTAQEQSSSPFFDLRSPHLRFLNNVESDPSTQRWSPSLHGFLRQQWPGMPFQVCSRSVFSSDVCFSSRSLMFVSLLVLLSLLMFVSLLVLFSLLMFVSRSSRSVFFSGVCFSLALLVLFSLLVFVSHSLFSFCSLFWCLFLTRSSRSVLSSGVSRCAETR